MDLVLLVVVSVVFTPALIDFVAVVSSTIEIATLVDAFGVLFVFSFAFTSFRDPLSLVIKRIGGLRRQLTHQIRRRVRSDGRNKEHGHDLFIYRTIVAQRYLTWTGIAFVYSCGGIVVTRIGFCVIRAQLHIW